MSVNHSTVISGFNEFLNSQKILPGMCTMTMVQFNTERTRHAVRSPIGEVRPLDSFNYRPRGNTALYDAVVSTIDEVGLGLAFLPEEDRPEKVLVVIHSDGEENASRTFTADDVRKRIQTQTDVYSWKFAFVGTDFDVITSGKAIGIKGHSNFSFENTTDGWHTAYAAINRSVCNFRSMTPTCYAQTQDFFDSSPIQGGEPDALSTKEALRQP
jgi:hypothetical protein